MTDEKTLTAKSSLEEVFDFIRNPEQDVQVLPVTLNKPSDAEARMMILIQGKPDTANVLMANLMTYIQEMYDLAEQQAAANEIVAPDGVPLDDEPQIIIP